MAAGKIFVLITQLRNLTNRRVGFRFNYNGYCPLPELPPGKTRKFKQSRILRCGRERGRSPWTVLVLVDDSFTGIELCPSIVLDYTRILFRYVTADDGLEVLRVEGVPENCTDFLLRLKYFGFMRDMFWDSRASVEIPSANSRVAKKLREIEGQAGFEHLSAPLIPTLLKRTSCASPMSKTTVDSDTKTPPPPPPPPPSPSRMTRDGIEDTSTDTNSDDFMSSVVEESDHKSSTSSSDIGEHIVSSRRRIHDQIIRKRVSNINIHDHDRGLDSFDLFVLFLVALALVWCVPMLFGL